MTNIIFTSIFLILKSSSIKVKVTYSLTDMNFSHIISFKYLTPFILYFFN